MVNIYIPSDAGPTTVSISHPDGTIIELVRVDPKFWKHSSPVEWGQYKTELDSYVTTAAKEGQLIYHYTTLTGLHGIVRDACLWASDVRSLNDKSEIIHALRDMKNMVEVCAPDLLKEPGFGDTFDLGREFLYAACFSKSRDQLSQWRAYGANMAVSIGFDRFFLEQCASQAGGELRDVGYGKFNDTLQAKLLPILNELKGSDRRLADFALKKHAVSKKLKLLAGFQKHGSFSEENEVRFLGQREHVSDVSFRSTAERLTPYVVLPLVSKVGGASSGNFANKLGIVEVLLWPSDADNQVIESIGMLLDTVGGALVRRSNCPYRS